MAEEKAYTSSKITTYSSYNSIFLENDIGIIELSENVTFSSNIAPIVVDFDYVDADLSVTVSGFGKTKDGDQFISNSLQYATLQTISNTDCAKTYQKVYESMICASGKNLESTCNVSVYSIHDKFLFSFFLYL